MAIGIGRFDQLSEAYQALLRYVIEDGADASPRGERTREVLAAGLVLTNPRERLIRNAHRRWSQSYAAAETLWHLAASKNPRLLSVYSKFWCNWSEQDSFPCYGARIFEVREGLGSRWESLLSRIDADNETRQATLVIDSDEGNVRACATSMSLFLRNDRLHMVVNMRSNDVFLGFGYDVFFFTTLLEMACTSLGCGIGTYSHFMGSAHVYERHLERARAVAYSDPIGGMTPPIESPKVLLTAASCFVDHLSAQRPLDALIDPQDPFADWCLDRVREPV